MKKTLMTLMAALAAVMSFAQTAVTPPSTATVETWWIETTMGYMGSDGQPATEAVSEEIQVAFAGDDVYFFFPNPLNGGAWVKGSKDSNGNYLFYNGQYQGQYDGQNIYFCGVTTDDNDPNKVLMANVTFYYDSQAAEFANYGVILMNSSTSQYAAWCYFSMTTIMRNKPEAELAITPPEGVNPQNYLLRASSILYNQDGSYAGSEPVEFVVKVAFSGSSEVYIQGLCQDQPSAWAKGTIDDGVCTFEQGQYLGGQYLKYYLCGQFVGQLSNFECTYDASTSSFSGGSYYLVINSSKTALAPWAVYAGVTITKYEEKAATPKAPSIMAYYPYTADEGAAFLMLDIEPVDTEGNALLADNLYYKLYQDIDGTVSDYVFNKQNYYYLPQPSMTELPFTYNDSFDIYYAGSRIALYDATPAYQRLGVQTIYRAGSEERRSDIVWFSLADAAGVQAATARATVVGESFTDLQGRPVGADARGLMIRRQHMSDGTVRTTKVVR
ncbi:MAG: hypothetical protein IJ637_01260 [Prevotella sp.]|nr:hypothetical protein [Prevotella sp.]